MSDKADNEQPAQNRRDFFRALFGEPTTEELARTEERKGLAKRASILALTFAKNSERITRIALEPPAVVDTNLFNVTVNGRDSGGNAARLDLHVNTESGEVRRLVRD